MNPPYTPLPPSFCGLLVTSQLVGRDFDSQRRLLKELQDVVGTIREMNIPRPKKASSPAITPSLHSAALQCLLSRAVAAVCVSVFFGSTVVLDACPSLTASDPQIEKFRQLLSESDTLRSFDSFHLPLDPGNTGHRTAAICHSLTLQFICLATILPLSPQLLRSKGFVRNRDSSSRFTTPIAVFFAGSCVRVWLTVDAERADAAGI